MDTPGTLRHHRRAIGLVKLHPGVVKTGTMLGTIHYSTVNKVLNCGLRYMFSQYS